MKQLLLADDNPDLRSALRLMLETRLDLKTIMEAHDMEHVLALAKDAQPDCIVLDWELPGRPVSERIMVLRALVPEVQIIVASARPEAREQALSEGADSFIDKANSPLLILEAMRRCMKERTR